MYAIHCVKDDGAIDLMYDVLFVDPMTTRYIRQFQGMWKWQTSIQPQYIEWCSGFQSFLQDSFDNTWVQMNQYHNEYSPPCINTNTDTDTDSCDNSKCDKGHAKKNSW